MSQADSSATVHDLCFLYVQSLNKFNMMGMDETLRLFTETAQEEGILN